MNLSNIYAVIVDDDIIKASEIRRALNFNRITDVAIVSNQEKLWEAIYHSEQSKKKVNLIVTDMEYPLIQGGATDPKAGLKLIDRMKQEQIDIPVIICSSGNYQDETGILGSVWFNPINDNFEFDFKEILGRLV